MCSDNDITTLTRHIKILTTRFYAAVKNSRKTLIRALGTTPLPRSRQAKSPGYPKINQEAHWRYTYPPSKQNNPSCHTLPRVVKVCYRNHETPSRYLDWIGALQKQQLKQPPLKMPDKDAGDTSGIHNLRPQPTSREDTIYIDAGHESLNQYIQRLHGKEVNNQLCRLEALQKQQLKQSSLKMPATDAGKTSGICSLRLQPTSPEYTLYMKWNY